MYYIILTMKTVIAFKSTHLENKCISKRRIVMSVTLLAQKGKMGENTYISPP